jgi:hypothetical protein
MTMEMIMVMNHSQVGLKVELELVEIHLQH